MTTGNNMNMSLYLFVVSLLCSSYIMSFFFFFNLRLLHSQLEFWTVAASEQLKNYLENSSFIYLFSCRMRRKEWEEDTTLRGPRSLCDSKVSYCHCLFTQSAMSSAPCLESSAKPHRHSASTWTFSSQTKK